MDTETAVGSILMTGPAIMAAAGLMTAWYISRSSAATLSGWLAPTPPSWETIVALAQGAGIALTVMARRARAGRKLLIGTSGLCALVVIVARILSFVTWREAGVGPGSSAGASFVYLAGSLHLILVLGVLLATLAVLIRGDWALAKAGSNYPVLWWLSTLFEAITIVIIIWSTM